MQVTAGTVEYPTSVVFLDAPPNRVEGRFELKQGRLYRESNETFVAMDASISTPASLSQSDGVGTYILGAPAIVSATKQIDVPTSLEASGGTIAAAGTKDWVTLVHETRTPKPAEPQTIVTTLTVFKVIGDQTEKLSSFSFKDNLYNQYLSEVWPIDDSTLGIVTRSSRHSGIKTLFLFDIRAHKLEGMLEFSRLQFIPGSKSLWFASSVPNCDNLDEMLSAAKRGGRIIPVFENGAINNALRPMNDMDMDIDIEQKVPRSNQQGNVENSAKGPPTVLPANLQTAAPKLAATSISEDAASSAPWLVWAVMIFPATGLLWLLLKRRTK